MRAIVLQAAIFSTAIVSTAIVSTAIVSTAVFATVAWPAHAADPVLRRVTLSSGGVGQFEYSAQVEAGGTLSLDVPLDQVDDLLKSLRVDDPAGPPTVRLPGRQPLAESFRALPFGPAALASPQALLGALVGEAVRVPGPGVAGTILAVNEFDTALPNQGGTVLRHRLTIATAMGIETVVLQEVQGIEFASEALRNQVRAALAAIAAQRVQDRRTLQVTPAAGPARTIRFGYVVPAPVWKASYRVTIPGEAATGTATGAGAEAARLQGFAVVENLSGQPWREIEVVLTSGQPVLYHQALYDPVFTTRPDAPVDVGNRLRPQLDQGAVPSPERRRVAMPSAPAALSPPSPMMAPAPMASSVGGGLAEAEPPPPPSQVRQSVAQVEFRLTAPVTAAPGESLMLPIAGRDVPARRIALFQPETDPVHPLVALLIRNDQPGAMPPGLATLFERQQDGTTGFIGDARLPAIQPGEERLASFASDLAVRIDTTRSADMPVTGGSAAGGVLTLVRRERAVTAYRVSMPAGSGRTVMIEQPKRPGWTLVQPAGDEATPTHHRVVRTFAAGETGTVEIVLERPRSERVVLADANAGRLLALSQEGLLPGALRAALGQAIALRTELDRRAGVLKGLRDARAGVVADQERVRSNLGAVPANSELQRRYLGLLQQQENELAALVGQTDAAQRAVTQADDAWKAYLQSMAF